VERATSGRGGRVRALALAGGPAAFALVLALPLDSLGREAHWLAAVFAWAVVYWVTQAVPLAVTALLSSALAIATGVAPATAVLAAYGDPVIFLFVGSFILAEAIRATRLDHRFAFGVLRQGWATRTPGRTLATLGTVTCVMSLWVSNTATTAIMLPIALSVLRALGGAGADGAPGAPPLPEPGAAPPPGTSPAARPIDRFSIGLMLMLTWSASVAVGVPVASPPNLIAIGMIRDLTDRRLSFFDWIAVTMPLTAVMLVVCWVILRRRYGTVTGPADDLGDYAAAQWRALGPWRRDEINVAAVFLAACLLWVLPGAVALAAGPDAASARALERHLPESVVALLAAAVLFALPVDLQRGRFTLTWKQAAGIDWGTILMFGGGLSLGRLMFETGLAAALGHALVRLSGAESVWGLTAVAIAAGVMLSEASSNTASASMLLPVVIAVARGLDVSPIPPGLGAALGASFGFMLPVSTPPNAIVYGSGLVPLREMITAGALLDVTGVIIIWAGLRILCPLFGVM
jgi:sodium-dependent dicarboxylate transporter 2/3/5